MLHRHFSVGLAILFLTWGTLPAEEVTVGFHQFRIPDGFQLELVAGPNLVERPIAISQDDDGALYVTDSAGMSDRADKQLELKPHRIRKLIDEDHDGFYDKSILFADGMQFPEGCLWYEGSVYVAAPPHIRKLTDTDGDGKCDEREFWYDGQTLTGCGNDLHGPYLGPDGWFYWTKGAFAEQTHTINGQPFTTRSSHIFRSLPDGSRMEPILTGGMDNPVNVAFLPNGEKFLSCTFFQHPANGQRDGLIHCIYGGVYGKKHDSIYEHPMTGDVMPVMTHMGAAAPCGLIGSSGRTFGQNSQHNQLFACYFNLHRVVEHTLIPNGPTYTTTERDLMASDHPDFHPTDVFEDIDGSLLIVDTGGWYKICCPTSQLAKPDVLGGIYRLSRKGQPTRETKLNVPAGWSNIDSLIYNLLDPGRERQSVVQRAVRELRKQGAEGIKALLKLSDFEEHTGRTEARMRVIWTFAGMNSPEARAAVRECLQWEDDPAVQLVGLSAVSQWRDADAFDIVVTLVDSKDRKVASAAVAALGRMGNKKATAILLDALVKLDDVPSGPLDEAGAPLDSAARVSEHAIINALMELQDAESLRISLEADSVSVRRAALVALDQMRGDHLAAPDVMPFLDHVDPRLSVTAAWIVGQHPQWGAELVDYYDTAIQQHKEATDAERADTLSQQIARMARSETVQELIRRTLDEGSPSQRRLALRAITLSGLPVTPDNWLGEVAVVLPTMRPEDQLLAIAEIRRWPLPKDGNALLSAALLEIGRSENMDAMTRLEALQHVTPAPELTAALSEWLVQSAKSNSELGLRLPAMKVLARAQLTPDQQMGLLFAVLPEADPIELSALLPAFYHGLEGLGTGLVRELPKSRGFSGLRADQLQSLFASYPEEVREMAKPLLKQLNPSIEEQTAHLEGLLANLQPGDVRRGHEIFNSQKAKCITCHTRAYNGGRLGPDLTNIGKVRNTRDLAEAIIFPSASLVRGYEPVSVALADGRVLAGIIKSESRDEIVLGLDAEKVQHVLRSEIEEIKPSSVSLMPQGMDKVLTPQDIADLIAFLQQ